MCAAVLAVFPVTVILTYPAYTGEKVSVTTPLTVLVATTEVHEEPSTDTSTK